MVLRNISVSHPLATVQKGDCGVLEPEHLIVGEWGQKEIGGRNKKLTRLTVRGSAPLSGCCEVTFLGSVQVAGSGSIILFSPSLLCHSPSSHSFDRVTSPRFPSLLG